MAFEKIGAGWSRTAKTTGEKFISLDIEGRKLMLFKNKKKEKDTQPDYVVIEAKDDPAPPPTEAQIRPEEPEDTAVPPDDVKPEDTPF